MATIVDMNKSVNKSIKKVNLALNPSVSQTLPRARARALSLSPSHPLSVLQCKWGLAKQQGHTDGTSATRPQQH